MQFGTIMQASLAAMKLQEGLSTLVDIDDLSGIIICSILLVSSKEKTPAIFYSYLSWSTTIPLRKLTFIIFNTKKN